MTTERTSTMTHPHTGYDHILMATSDTHRVYERRFWWNNERNTETQPLYIVTNHRNQASHKIWGDKARAMEVAGISEIIAEAEAAAKH